MQYSNRWIIVVVVGVTVLLAAGCDRTSSTSKATAAAVVKKSEDSGPRRIKLTETEAKYLGIKFAVVTQNGAQLIAPYNTLLYDASGHEWVFVSPEPNVFTRTAIKVEKIEGDTVFLIEGPAVGTKLVTHGAAELYGIEFGVGK